MQRVRQDRMMFLFLRSFVELGLWVFFWDTTVLGPGPRCSSVGIREFAEFGVQSFVASNLPERNSRLPKTMKRQPFGGRAGPGITLHISEG